MSKWHDLSGEQKEQILITTDENGKPIGQATRNDCHKGSGKTHLAFVAFLFDGEGNIYIQKRSQQKSLWDGHWDVSIVSHVLPGETVQQAAQRRGMEELGVDTEFQDLGGFFYFAQYNGNCENEYCHVLIGKSVEEVIHNPVEIEEIKKIKLEDLKKEVKNKKDKFTPWLKIALEKFALSPL
ncbi:hypothetical protein A2773_04695 [Candidatus Gottesmanbacteria bacterium RIFCSPHIGHO2_01_FULL_39_10]|uniref:isopentenyl-diphosphate Delta-isomerase n=1 Tax=Candidatus Gottesmanbacteria bacterium RIFCSPHIGHO2_01_FULL_39_10 TaxID=1798375 RepID=A0A1F5ZRS5_9BACT|nr:MAG: hypothetical protein A2773_04695 [Candidatus Gottesmanbacteria bacterium RIFCSPHIGHO2_01_FULL_39_10]